MKKKILIAVPLVMAAGLSALALRQRAAQLRVTCERGRVASYDFSYHSSGMAKPTALMPMADGEQRIAIDLEGRWQETCLESSDDHVLLAVSTTGLKGKVESSMSGVPSGTPAAALEASAFVELSPLGEVKQIRYRTDDERSVRVHVLRDLLSLRSFVLADSAARGDGWQSEESDLQGTYRSDYVLDALDEQELRVTKQRRAYVLDADQRQGEGLVPVVAPESRSTLRLSRSGQVRELEALAHVEHRLQKDLVGSTRAQLHLVQTSGDERASEQAIAALERELRQRKHGKADLRGSEVDARLARQMDQQELGSESWPSLRARLEPLTDIDHKLLLQLKSLFRVHPELALEAGKLLDTYQDANDPRFQMLTGGLSGAGTPEAQQALTAAMSRISGDDDRQRVLIGMLGLVEKPTVESERALLALSKAADSNSTVQNTANLALGTFASSLEAEAPGRSQAIVEHLLGELEHADGSSARNAVVAALGNSGAHDALEPVLDSLDQPDPVARRVAATALHSFGSERDANERLLKTAEADESAEVRLAAVASLERHELTPADVRRILVIARNDESESVRSTALRVATREASEVPEVMVALVWARDNDRSDEVKKTATLMIARLQMTSKASR